MASCCAEELAIRTAFAEEISSQSESKCGAITVDINDIALFRQAIGSSPSRNDGTASPETIGSGMDVGVIVDDEVLHKLISMVEKNELVEELMIAVVDNEYNVTKFDG
ncbi:hypothetical protein Tco_0719000 [Tanacetum coccineum]